MYVPKQFEETRTDVLHELMRAHPFAALVTHGSAGLGVDHIPFTLSPDPAPYGTLRGHVARANPVWQQLSDACECIVVFQGPHAYISPSLYPSKYEHGKVVPTWNYAVVHAHGTVRAIEDREWLRALVGDLTDSQESTRAKAWRVSDAPEDFTDAMLGAIVGIELPIARLVGKWKVSQNRGRADRLGVIAGLESNADTKVLAAMVRERLG